jgi:hypothetical protein
MTIGQEEMTRASALAPQAVTGEGLFLRGFSITNKEHSKRNNVYKNISLYR